MGSAATWRATAGECGKTPPTVERSTDDGATWTDVTPTYRGLAQISSLDAFTDTQGELVGAVGSTCQTQALRTFTQGQFWESYPDVLAASTYLDPADPSVVVTPTGRVDALCAAPTSLRSSDDEVALICDGSAYTLGRANSWTAVDVPDSLALAMSPEGILVAHTSIGCTGVAVSLVAPSAAPVQVACATTVDPAVGPVAIASDGDRLLVWAGGVVTDLAL
ncbi:hypothetical protein [uncultured Microbacterium sp.]|uniref:hypothetical protein n=1 Tax=uncultured Microbacterium sp. TaxID=191216 RepID=UPI0035C97257